MPSCFCHALQIFLAVLISAYVANTINRLILMETWSKFTTHQLPAIVFFLAYFVFANNTAPVAMLAFIYLMILSTYSHTRLQGGDLSAALSGGLSSKEEEAALATAQLAAAAEASWRDESHDPSSTLSWLRSTSSACHFQSAPTLLRPKKDSVVLRPKASASLLLHPKASAPRRSLLTSAPPESKLEDEE